MNNSRTINATSSTQSSSNITLTSSLNYRTKRMQCSTKNLSNRLMLATNRELCSRSTLSNMNSNDSMKWSSTSSWSYRKDFYNSLCIFASRRRVSRSKPTSSSRCYFGNYSQMRISRSESFITNCRSCIRRGLKQEWRSGNSTRVRKGMKARR